MRKAVDLLSIAVLAGLGVWQAAEPAFVASSQGLKRSWYLGAAIGFILVAALNLARRAAGAHSVSRLCLAVNVASLVAAFTVAVATGILRAWLVLVVLLALTLASLPPPDVVLGRARG